MAVVFAFSMFLGQLALVSTTSPWPPAAVQRAQNLVAQLTLAEKLSLLQGDGEGTYAGTLPAIPRLGFSHGHTYTIGNYMQLSIVTITIAIPPQVSLR